MVNRTTVQDAIGAGSGILRLEPTWVPRTFMLPGRRLKLHPDDLYALGGHRGGINERWFSSTTNADNGPGTPPDEGLSYVSSGGQRFLLKEAVDTAGDLLIGAATMARGICSASSSTTSARFPITCTRARSRQRRSAAAASPRRTTSRLNTTRS